MSTSESVSIGKEIRAVASSFERALTGLVCERERRVMDRGMKQDNIMLLLPFLLAERFRFENGVTAARVMALGNAFGAAHFLAQDRVMDGEEQPSPGVLHLCDRCLSLFLREYGRLFPAGSHFWDHFDRYLSEYFSALTWEREHLWTDSRAPIRDDESFELALVQLARKMAPLKVTCAAFALLSGDEDLLPSLERVVEDYHVAYQISDDLSDLSHDASARMWSLAMWVATKDAGLTGPPSGLDPRQLLELAVRSGALSRLAGIVEARYGSAGRVAGGLGLVSLSAYLEQSRLAAKRSYGWLARRTRLVMAGSAGRGRTALPRASLPARNVSQLRTTDVDAASRADAASQADAARELDVHCFEAKGRRFVYDPASGLLFDADPVSAEVLAWCRGGKPPSELDSIRMNYGARATTEALSEITELAPSVLERIGSDAAGDPGTATAWTSRSIITTVALNVTDGCNLKCSYCYRKGTETSRPPRLMQRSVALRAVDLLMDESFGEDHVSVVFFGGEPLLNLPLIENVIDYTRERAIADCRSVTFHMTTNGTLMSRDVSALLDARGVSVLVSIDGCRADHDANRVFTKGHGSYDAVVRNIRSLPRGARVGARVTVCEGSDPLGKTVKHLADLGFSVVHLSPVSGSEMSHARARQLAGEFEDLAGTEMERLARGGTPLVGNFMETVLAMDTGRRRLSPCGAGTRYVCVSPDGTLYLCHRLAEDPLYEVGNVSGGLARDSVAKLLGDLSAEAGRCSDCWARYLCGGPCYFDLRSAAGGTALGDSPRCYLTRRIIELSMWLYASLPERSRARLRDISRRSIRPEMETRDRGSTG